MEIIRLRPSNAALARETFLMMGEAFDDPGRTPLTDQYLVELLARENFWAYAAVLDDQAVGGVTAHVLPMTRTESGELFIYDLAVRSEWQRRGIGRSLIRRLREDGAAAGIAEMWVPADNEDTDALEFYRRTGGAEQAATIFTYSAT